MKIVALAVWPIFFLASFLLFKASGLSWKRHSFSDLGVSPRVGKVFNAIFVSVGLTQLAFFFYVLWFSTFDLFFQIAILLLATTTVSGIFVGIVNEKINKRLHTFIAALGFIVSSPGWFLVSLYLMKFNLIAALLLAFWGIVIIPFLLNQFAKHKLVTASKESLLFLGAFLTNIFLLSNLSL
jgi:hypothetical protein